ncbi:MAG: tRNA lysidine(34) synthetase TilS [Opitutales bacterium]
MNEGPRAVDWPAVARRLAPRFHGSAADLGAPPEVRALWADLPAGAEVAVLCSGGADSVCAALWALTAPERDARRVILFSFDHRTRPASAAEVEGVAHLARALGAQFVSRAAEPRSENSTEATLRAAREAGLAAWEAARATPLAAILTGHQADDVAENLLFRVGRGSGLAGLSGLRAVQTFRNRPPRLRPLLGVGRAALREALAEAGGIWSEDPSNVWPIHARNRLRRDVVPAWQTALPERDVVAGAGRVHRLLGEVHAWVEARVAAILQARAERPRLPLGALATEPPFLRASVLQAFLLECSGQACGEDLARACLALETGEACNVPGGRVARVGEEWVFAPAREVAAEASWPADWQGTLPVPGSLALPSGARLEATIVSLAPAFRERLLGGQFQPSNQVWIKPRRGPLRVRFRQPGDRYRPLRAPGSRKVQDCFVDAGIPQDRRHRVPLLCGGAGEVLWIPGLPPAHSERLGPEASQALRLTYMET